MKTVLLLASALGSCATAQAQPHAPEAFRLDERDLVPEGIAYDATSDTFYLSSVHKAKIVEVDRATGLSRDFVEEREHGFLGGVGLLVDARNRRLFAASTVTNQVRGFTKEDEGRAGLFVFSLDDGSLVARHLLDHRETPHLLNDLTMDDEGTVYVTDTLTASLYFTTSDGDLELFVHNDALAYPNGIAFVEPGLLFVANDTGITTIDIESRTVEPLSAPESIRTVGIDGLYAHRGSLFAVQNHKGLNRVARFAVDFDERRVLSVEVLEEDHPVFDVPTTGALVEDSFFVIANSHLGSFDEEGRLAPLERLTHPVVLEIDIAR